MQSNKTSAGTNSSEVIFTDTSKECIQVMKKLAKKALRKGGKEVTTKLKEKVPAKTGNLRKSVYAQAKIDSKTGQPYLRVGYYSKAKMRKKYGIKHWANPAWFEFGTKPHSITVVRKKALSNSDYFMGTEINNKGMAHKNYLRNTAYDNIDEIQNAIKESLKELETYVLTEGMYIDMNEGDEPEDDEE